jgi:uncharacterized coiled-coil DUF342 family protein
MSGTPLDNFTKAVAQIGQSIKPIIDNNNQFGRVSATMKQITTELKALNTRIATLDGSIQGLIAYINELKGKKGDNTGDITGTTAEIERLRRQLRDSEMARQQLQNEIQAKDNKIAELTAYIEERERLIQQCESDKAVIKNDLERHAQQIRALQDELDRLRGGNEEIKRLQAQIQQLTTQNQNLVVELQQKDANITQLTNDLATQTALAARLQTQLDNLAPRLAQLQAEIAQYRQDLATSNTLITQLRAENKTLNDEILRATQTVTNLNDFLRRVKTIVIDPEDTANVGREITALQNQLTKLEDDIAGINRGPGPSSSSSSGRGATGNENPSFAERRSAFSNINPYESVSKSSNSYGNVGSTGAVVDNPLDISPSNSNIVAATAPLNRAQKQRAALQAQREQRAATTFTEKPAISPEQAAFDSTLKSSGVSSSSSVNAISNQPRKFTTNNGIEIPYGMLMSVLGNQANPGETAWWNKIGISPPKNPYGRAYNELDEIVKTKKLTQQMIDEILEKNGITVENNNGQIVIKTTSKGGKKSKKTKKKRIVRKQTGGFEYSGKSKRRRFSVTRSPRSSSPRSSQRSSSQERSTYETQSSVPPKYRARGSKKSKM